MKLDHIKRLRGSITVVTGLHIGAGRETMEIGGMDNPVIRNPANGEPYIPGSSLKGKMRSTLELISARVERSGRVHTCAEDDCPVCRIFGTTEEATHGPTRLIVRDGVLDRAATAAALSLDEGFPISDIIEVKYENTINRITGTAQNPRPLERVVPGSVFTLEILYKVFIHEGETPESCKDATLFDEYVPGLIRALEKDALGGSGSRGSGQVKIELRKPEIVTLETLTKTSSQ